jgi:hypothetical protein
MNRSLSIVHMETHFRIINDELLQQRTQDYDYCTDRRGSVDPAVISELLQHLNGTLISNGYC